MRVVLALVGLLSGASLAQPDFASAGCSACCGPRNNCSRAVASEGVFGAGICCGILPSPYCCAAAHSCISCQTSWRCSTSRTVTLKDRCEACSDDPPNECQRWRGWWADLNGPACVPYWFGDFLLWFLLLTMLLGVFYFRRRRVIVVQAPSPQAPSSSSSSSKQPPAAPAVGRPSPVVHGRPIVVGGQSGNGKAMM